MRTPQFVLQPFGVNRPAFSIPGVSQIKGVFIDNPSGAWLHLMPSDDYIAPYTMGFARSFPFPIVSCDLRWEAPAGQVSTFAGDFPTLILTDDDIADSAGSSHGDAFIEQFTPVLQAFSGNQLVSNSAGLKYQIVAGVANKRIRVLKLDLAYGTLGGAVIGFMSDCPVHAIIDPNIAFTVSNLTLVMRLNSDNPHDQLVFPGGLDWATGQSVWFTLTNYWSLTGSGVDTSVMMTASYQLI